MHLLVLNILTSFILLASYIFSSVNLTPHLRSVGDGCLLALGNGGGGARCHPHADKPGQQHGIERGWGGVALTGLCVYPNTPCLHSAHPALHLLALIKALATNPF